MVLGVLGVFDLLGCVGGGLVVFWGFSYAFWLLRFEVGGLVFWGLAGLCCFAF